MRAASAAVEAAGRGGRDELTIVLTDDAEVQDLNARYRGLDQTTDVLSFGLFEPAESPTGDPLEALAPLGDVVISYPRAVAQAQELGHPVDEEVAWLVVHGTLQLLGYRHDTPEEAKEMSRVESRILRDLGMQSVQLTDSRLG